MFQLNVVSVKMYLNQVICREGDYVNGMYLVVKGSIKY